MIAGPWGAAGGAILGTVIAVTKLTGGGVDAKKLYGELGSVINNDAAMMTTFTAALVASGGVVGSNTQKVAQLALSHTNLVEKASKAGLTEKDLTNAITGSDGAFNKVVATWRASGHPANTTIGALLKMREEFQRGGRAARTYANEHEIVMKGDIKSGTIFDLLSGKLGNYNTHNLSAQGSAVTFSAKLGNLTESVRRNGTSLDANTSFGMHNRDAIRAAATAAIAHAQAVYQSEVKTRGATRATHDALADLGAAKTAFAQAATKAGLNATQANAVWDAMYKLKGAKASPSITINSNYLKVQRDLTGFSTWYDLTFLPGLVGAAQKASIATSGFNLPGAGRAPTPVPTVTYAGHDSLRKARGGEIFGPGTTTSDSIPTWLSRGEFVINAAEYARNRAAIKALNMGRPDLAAQSLMAHSNAHSPFVHMFANTVAGRMGDKMDNYAKQNGGPSTASVSHVNSHNVTNHIHIDMHSPAARGADPRAVARELGLALNRRM